MPKKVLSLVILFILFISTANMSMKANEAFHDLGSVPWAEDAIYFLNDRGVINGYGKGEFGPNDKITREQAALMLVRELYPNETSSTKLPFADVKPNSFYYNAIAVAVDHQLFEGFPEGTFKPKEPITRAATAKILALAYGLIGENANFTDLHKAPWAVAYIAASASNNISNGYPDNTFKPNKSITRAEFSLSLSRILDDRFKPKPAMMVKFLNVGQGDAIYIQYPNGKTALVDAGRSAAAIDKALKEANITQIDTFIATHPDADHIGGAAHVIKNYGVTKVIDSGQSHTTQTYFDYIDAIKARGSEFIVAGIGYNVTDDPNVSVDVLFVDSAAPDLNDGSIVMMLSYGLTDFLLTGDAGIDVEQYLMSNYDLEAEVLKVSHHGSNTGTSGDFIEAVTPYDAILSYGNNSYGHPNDEVVNDLVLYGIDIYSTFEQGTITASTTGNSYSINVDPVQWDIIEPEPVEPNPVDPNNSGQTSNQVKIIAKNLSTEMVTIKNTGFISVNMTNWALVSVEGNQTYTFPDGFVLTAGASVSITSGPNAVHNPPAKLKWTGSNIWNNSGDAAKLLDPDGKLIHQLN